MRIARLDGLRGVAIALVIAFHTLRFTYGWIGVDLFFVLSGYLVTSILRRDRNDAAFWKPFYIKRATRILPPFLIALLVCAIFCRAEWHRMWFYYTFALANFGLIPTNGGGVMFGGLWSLAVEEHFYLLWPFAIRFLSGRTLVRLLICILILEPILRGVVTPFTDKYWITYALTPFRLDGLAAGALLAILMEAPPSWLAAWSKRAGIFALLAIVAMAVTHRFNSKENTLLFNVVGYSLTAIGFASLLAYVLLRAKSWMSTLLESRALIFLGTISYGVYLFHRPIFEAFTALGDRHGWHHHAALLPVALPVALLLCWLLFRFVESRMIVLGHRWAKQVRIKAGNTAEPMRAAS
jgi:peptidoglycan/LPS O-acetylase OafA/YrhL